MDIAEPRTLMMMMSLLAELCTEWSDKYSVEQVWLDDNKVAMLDEAHTMLVGQDVVIPISVRELYSRIFVKPMWGENDRGSIRESKC